MLRPDMRAVRGIDQLAGDAQSIARLAHAALEDVTHAQLAGHLANVGCFALVGKSRVPGDDEEPAQLGKRRDDEAMAAS